MDRAIDARALACFEAGDRLEDEGRYDDAFAAYAEGNRLLRAGRDVAKAAQDLAARVDQSCAFFSQAFFALSGPKPGSPRGKTAPIFVIGLPRCGSSLVEQILATHARVQGLGETTLVADVTRRAYPLTPSAPPRFPALAQAYLAAARQTGWRGWGRFVDKQLGNYTAVGMIHCLFPTAPILHVSRDPADVCLSAFRKPFQSIDLSFDLADLGLAHRLYQRSIDHWRAVLPGRVTDISYERLVADFPAEARRLVEACDLPWDERCLRFYENDRPVRTASEQQVRKPIFADSIGRWRNYRAHLAPLLEALGPYAPTDA